MSYDLTALTSWESAALKAPRPRSARPSLPSGLPELPTLTKIQRLVPTWTASYNAWGLRQRARRQRRTVVRVMLFLLLGAAATGLAFAAPAWESVVQRLLPPPAPQSAAALVPVATPAAPSEGTQARTDAAPSEVVPAPPPAASAEKEPSPRRVLPPKTRRASPRAVQATAPAEKRRARRGHELTAAEIVDGFRSQARSIAPCLRAARNRGEILPGSLVLVLSWNITPRGRVTGAELSGPATVANTTLRTCVPQQMRNWEFPAPNQVTPVENFPMRVRIP